MRTRSGPAPPPICVNTVLAKLPKVMTMGGISAAVGLWLNFPPQAFRRSPRPASLNVTAAKPSRALSCARSTRWPASSAAATAAPLPLRIRRRDGMLRECTGRSPGSSECTACPGISEKQPGFPRDSSVLQALAGRKEERGRKVGKAARPAPQDRRGLALLDTKHVENDSHTIYV